MAVRLSTLRTRRTLPPRNIVIFMFLVLISVRVFSDKVSILFLLPVFSFVACVNLDCLSQVEHLDQRSRKYAKKECFMLTCTVHDWIVHVCPCRAACERWEVHTDLVRDPCVATRGPLFRPWYEDSIKIDLMRNRGLDSLQNGISSVAG
jgi:hypothetical protein